MSDCKHDGGLYPVFHQETDGEYTQIEDVWYCSMCGILGGKVSKEDLND